MLKSITSNVLSEIGRTPNEMIKFSSENLTTKTFHQFLDGHAK